MKIALVIEHFDATRGGAEHLAVWVANEMAKRGHEVHVVCHDVTGRVNKYMQATLRASHDAEASFRAFPPAEAPHDGLHVHRLKGMRVNTALGLRRFGTRARKWCDEHRPEVVHSLSVAFAGDIYHAYAGVYAAMQTQAAASRHTTATATLKRVLLRMPGKQRMLLAMETAAVAGAGGGRKRGAKRVISLCAMMTRQFVEHYGAAAKKKIVEMATPRLDISGARGGAPGASEEEGREMRQWFRGVYGIGETDRVAVFVGHDFRRKGLRYAIEAIARSKTGWKLLVVGLGKAREYVELADALGIGDAAAAGGSEKGGGSRRVLFVGPTREMGSVYAAADALLLPTFYDPSGLVVREAFGYGLPVVSTEFLGASDLVKRHEVGAIVASPRDVAGLAAGLDGLPPRGTAEQKQMAERARGASDGNSAVAYIDGLLALYEQVRAE